LWPRPLGPPPPLATFWSGGPSGGQLCAAPKRAPVWRQ
jgi:hypothetical protein